MAYKKSSKKKKYSKPKPKSRFDTYAECGKQATADGLALYTLVKPFLPFNAEYKRITSETTSNPSTTPVIGLKNAISQGDDANQRVGRSIRMTSLQVNQTLTKHASATQTFVRGYFLIDTQANATVMSDSDFHSTGFDINSFPNPDYQGRFRVLKQYRATLTTDKPVSVRSFRVPIPRRLGRVEYNGTNGGTIADINKSALYHINVSSESTNTPTVVTNSRILFIDN